MNLSEAKTSRLSYENFRRTNSTSALNKSNDMCFEVEKPLCNLEEDILNISLQLDQLKSKRPQTTR